MGYILSVDGGGTKTEFLLCRSEGEVITSFKAGAGNYRNIGRKKAFDNFREGLDRVLKEADITKEEIDYSVWGISGCDTKKDYAILCHMIQELGIPYGRYEVCNDAVLGYYAQADGSGMAVVAGTGSIVWGIGRKGEYCRKGGWGHLLSDGGSGYWIGSMALQKTILYCEGCYPHSQLFDSVQAQFQAGSVEELLASLAGLRDIQRIASVARIVTELGRQGDKESRKILEKGAELLTDMLQAVYETLDFRRESRINLVMSGGVLKSEEYIRVLKKEIACRNFRKNIKYVEQINAPVQGGICLAEKRITKA